MAKVKKSPLKKTTKSKKVTKKSVYDCDDVESYLSRAVERVKDNIIPRITALDRRDQELFNMSKEHTDSYGLILSNQETLKANQEILGERQKRISEDFIPEIKEKLEKLHDKIDAHIIDEAAEFSSIRSDLSRAAAHTKEIQMTLDNVSANGNKGLSASITDMYEKLKDLEKITEGARVRSKFWKLLHDLVETTPLLKPFKYKWGAIIYVIFLLLIINTLLHAFGVEFDVMSIIKVLISLVKGA